MTQLADELLVSYTDGQMSAAQCEAVRQVLADDPETAARVDALEISRHQFVEAFAAMLAAEPSDSSSTGGDVAPAGGASPVSPPAALREQELDAEFEREAARAHRAAQPSSPAAPAHVENTTEKEPDEDAFWDDEEWEEETSAAETAGWGLTLTAGLLGIWLAGAVTGYFLYEGIARTQTPAVPVRAAKAPRQDMLTLAAHAHTLFRRENLEISAPSQGNPTLMAFHLAKIFNRDIPVPDLEAHQLSFKRAQVLNLGAPLSGGHNNAQGPANASGAPPRSPRPLVAQISYLGESGGPIALYITPGQGARAISKTHAGHVNAVAWAQDGLKYVLAGDLPHWHLIVLAATIQRQTKSAEEGERAPT